MRLQRHGALIGIVGLLAGGCATRPGLEPGKPVSEFSATLLDGRAVSSGTLRGRVVVLDFWATWCPPCRAGLPHLQAMSTDPDLAHAGLCVIAVNEGEDDGTVRGFLTRNHYTFPTARDADGSLGRTFDVSVLPTTIVIGSDGVLKAIVTGCNPETASQLKNAVAGECAGTSR